MRKLIGGIMLLMLGASAAKASDPKVENKSVLAASIGKYYNELQYRKSRPAQDLFQRGIIGYLNLRSQGRLSDSSLLTLIDFRLSSNLERMWIIDLNKKEVIHQSLVAHGRNSGNEFATTFSNVPNSNTSSLGFYVTGETYYGKHGLSLRLDGVEKGINDNARKRAIVMHGADYVDKSFSEAYGRIGRSFGCPSIPVEGHEEIIRLLAGKSCMLIFYPDENYLNTSLLADEHTALEALGALSFLP